MKGSTGLKEIEKRVWLRSFEHGLWDIAIGLIWGGALAVGGWAVDLPRLYAYGVLLFGGLLVIDLASPGYHLGHVLIGIGGLIALVGAVLLVRFVRRYPLHPPIGEGEVDV